MEWSDWPWNQDTGSTTENAREEVAEGTVAEGTVAVATEIN